METVPGRQADATVGCAGLVAARQLGEATPFAPWLRVRVRSYALGECATAASDAGRLARRRLVQVRRRTPPLAEVLLAVEAAMGDLVTELYGSEAASWFRREHLLGLPSPERFDEVEGFNVCVLVPRSG